MGVADRTLKTFDYISKGLLPSDDARIRRRGDLRRTNIELLFRGETRGRRPTESSDATEERNRGCASKRKDTARPRVGRRFARVEYPNISHDSSILVSFARDDNVSIQRSRAKNDPFLLWHRTFNISPLSRFLWPSLPIDQGSRPATRGKRIGRNHGGLVRDSYIYISMYTGNRLRRMGVVKEESEERG